MNDVVRQLPPRGHYLAHEVGRLAGVSGQTIGQWARRGYIRSSQSEETPRVYSYQDVAEAMVVHELLDRGVTHTQIRRAISATRERWGNDWPLTHAPLAMSEGRLVVEADQARYDIGHRGWQQLLPSEDDLRRIASQLHRGGWAARELPELEHIEVDPERLSGRPVIRGTRVPAELVAELAEKPEGRQELREGYEVGDKEIDDALEWWRVVRRYEEAA
ncbi:MAG: DUF433 domain-containing protein [Gaiellaceae bacterium]